MTENEAKKKLESLHYKIIHTSFCNKVYESEIEALLMAIKALSEIQQYRAIGTVEGYERAIKASMENYKLYREYKAKAQEFEAIGTIEEFKALKEKDNKDFELLLKAVKESYPIFKGAYVELDVFMGDVMRRFTRDRKQS